MRLLQKKKYIPYIILAVFGIIFLITSVGNHYYFRTFAWDYGTYNFALWDYSHFNISRCYIYYFNEMTFLQDHFSLLFFLFIPIFWALNWLTGSYTLLIIQTVLILIGGLAIYKLILNKTRDTIMALAALILFFILQGRFSAFTGDCNIAILYSSIVPVYLYFFQKKNYLVSGIFLIILLTARENVAIWLFFIHIVLALENKHDKKALLMIGIFTLLSVIYFIAVFKVFIPLLETDAKKYSLFNYSALGKTPFEAFLFVLKHPIDTFCLLFENQSGDEIYDGIKMEFYLTYLLSGGILLFLRPKYLIWLIPIIAQKMLNDQPIRWSIEWYYSIEMITLLPISLILIIHDLKSKKLHKGLVIATCVAALGVTVVKSVPRQRKMGWWGTKKECFVHNNFFSSQFDVNELNKAIESIPDSSRVSSSARILSHVAQRKYIYHFPQVFDANYIIASKKKDFYVLTKEKYKAEIEKYMNDKSWEVKVNHKDFVLLHKIKK